MSRRANFITIACLALLLALISISNAAESSSSSTSSSSSGGNQSHGGSSGSGKSSSGSTTATQSRQSPMSLAATMVGALGSLVPGMITNIAPLMLILGVGALLMPSFGLSAMGLLRESRRSANDQPMGLNGAQLPLGAANPFAQYAARPIQTSPQDIYYFSKRSLPSLMPNFNSQAFFELVDRVARALDNADKRYN